MRQKFITANWKMFKDLFESIELIEALKGRLVNLNPNITVAVCPPFTSLPVASNLLKSSSLKLGAQNMS